MKIKTLSVYTLMLYGMLVAYMLGPAVSYKTGLPRIDNPLALLFIIMSVGIFFLENKRFPRKFAMPFTALTLMGGWASLHFAISKLTGTTFMDLVSFVIIPCFFYILYLAVSRHEDSLGFIRRLIALFAAFIVFPALAELLTGIQFVTADEVLSIESGTIKGLFFNPNNLATTAVCLAPAVLFFFNQESERPRDTLLGWLIYLALGVVILISVSRTAIGCYFLLTALYLIYRGNNPITLALMLGAFFAVTAVPEYMVRDFLLSLNSNEFLERFSSRVYLFLFDLGSDNSVSTRQEIYNYFWHNPPLLLEGFGPKNFRQYFGGHIGSSLGFENPHSFPIELYLGFGIVSMLAFAAYVLFYGTIALGSGRTVSSRAKMAALCAMLVFLIGGFIPSSILRLPFVWLPCFLICLYLISGGNRRKAVSL
ncbi:O-antigen ligase family protein [Neisseria chenwenguii]|uniref:Uncharacterized protein n=1 Tax=Neisseria chenwenguii TaxID=1853278 RepID=A0A220S048_9NEIS|nr:hypothetical protein [Neisseria chenwenguii]ASK26851.1 hypothetical protein BG910_03030 [Neisseria chenwenguii]ROV56829.1 O-antigen ligase domain-containing protein [Neisseria chenwenguii]